MRNSSRILALAAVAWLLVVASIPARAETGYQRPPQVLADIVEAPPTPGVRLSPHDRWLLLTETPSLLELADLAQPELRLAGMRINPATNGRSRRPPVRGLSLLERDTRIERPVADPMDARQFGTAGNRD